MIDAEAILRQLSAERPIFHSEADFQHAFAWQVHKAFPEAKVRLEYRVDLSRATTGDSEPLYLDLWILLGEQAVAIELKYLTRQLSVTLDQERYDLKDQSAQNLRSYDAIKDVVRLERVIAARERVSGFACILTNDSMYWRPARGGNNFMMDAFRLHEGRTLKGMLDWYCPPGKVKPKGRETALQLHNPYDLKWRDYSSVDVVAGGRFRYLLVDALPILQPL